MKTNTRKMTIIAMLCAMSYIAMFVCRIPVVLFLKYEPKDVLITIGGFLFGPVASFVISLVVSLVEMFTVSETGIIGCIMNLLSTCAFACTAAFVYKKKRTLSGAVTGLISGCLLMTSLMLLWNYLITPLYMGIDRSIVASMLLPVFLPFNLLKGCLNLSITLLLYKPVVTALRKTGLVESSNQVEKQKNKKIGVFLLSLLIFITCVMAILVWTGVI